MKFFKKKETKPLWCGYNGEYPHLHTHDNHETFEKLLDSDFNKFIEINEFCFQYEVYNTKTIRFTEL